MAFKVEQILDQSTIAVSPRWALTGYAGNSVKIKGFNLTDHETVDFIITKLRNLLLNKEVELRNPSNPVKKDNDNDEVTVSVYLNGVDISVYFPELRSVA